MLLPEIERWLVEIVRTVPHNELLLSVVIQQSYQRRLYLASHDSMMGNSELGT